tara:strand:+ start:3213 stop:4337 length:1125 start_codon:yes stop_codon:yes gene_type:complete
MTQTQAPEGMLAFSKYQGLGNDFILIEGRGDQLPAAIHSPDPAWVRRICDRRFGIGADGLILALPPQASGELRMRIFNADGSEAEMCGNGIRCLARFLADSDGDAAGRCWPIETPAGMIIPELQPDGQIRVDMGAPFLEPASVPTTLRANEAGLPTGEVQVGEVSLPVAAVGMGNPHVVVPVSDLTTIPFEEWGTHLEINSAFPAKTNVHFLQVHSRSQLEIRVWERGAGPTLACGTGACATLVAAVLLGLSDRQATVALPGGPLEISWAETTASVFMTGPADAVFDGVINPELMPAAQTASNGSLESQQGPRLVETKSAESTIKPVDDDCTEAEAQARVQAFLESTSLDSMINIATESLEQRTLSRFQRDGQG